MPANLPQRDGMTTLMNLAKTMCRLVQIFKPLIMQKFSGSVPIMALITAIEGVCEALPAAQASFYDPQGDNVDITEDPASTPGINPGAPEPPALPE